MPRPGLELVCTDRYPIAEPDSRPYTDLVRSSRAKMAAVGCVVLTGFVSAGAAQATADEIAPLSTFNRRHLTSAWGDPPAEEMAEDHIHRRTFAEDIHVIAGDQLGPGSALRQLYETDEINRLIADILRLPVLHRYADPYQDLNVIQLQDGGLHGWHYDLSDFVVTLLLQRSDQGGQFEFAPFIRGELNPEVVGGRDGRVWDERYEDVEQLFAGRWPDAIQLDLKPGDLVLFNGLRSMHRVRAAYGSTNRMIAVLSYDTKPNARSTDAINARLYGPRVNRPNTNRCQAT